MFGGFLSTRGRVGRNGKWKCSGGMFIGEVILEEKMQH